MTKMGFQIILFCKKWGYKLPNYDKNEVANHLILQ